MNTYVFDTYMYGGFSCWQKLPSISVPWPFGFSYSGTIVCCWLYLFRVYSTKGLYDQDQWVSLFRGKQFFSFRCIISFLLLWFCDYFDYPLKCQNFVSLLYTIHHCCFSKFYWSFKEFYRWISILVIYLICFFLKSFKLTAYYTWIWFFNIIVQPNPWVNMYISTEKVRICVSTV